jgi:predicted TIM-barrel fold metal-dependent hydrolase
MPVRGESMYAVLEPYLEYELERFGELELFDAHTHIGRNDPDGFSAEPQEILDAMDAAGQRRALLFAMQEPGGDYRPANDEVLSACAASAGRLLALARVDPKVAGAVDEARRCLDAGAVGVKLHPRSDAFGLPHPVVDELAALVGERRGILLFHAGRGIPNLGEDALSLATANPGLRIVLAHAGISDLGAIADAVGELHNVFFDTAWWQVSDLLALYCHVAPGQILHASDMPYGPGMFAAWADLRLGAAVGLSDDAMRSIAGGQLSRLVAGEDPLDLGPAPGVGALGPRLPAAERAIAYLCAATQLGFRGCDPDEALALARLACQTAGPGDPSAQVLAHVDRFAALSQRLYAEDPEDRTRSALAAVSGQLIAGTARVGLPPL